MLTIVVPLEEGFDESTSKFVVTKSYTLELEHSLASLSKWEEKYEKSFLGRNEKTVEETLFYIQECMAVSTFPPMEVLEKFTSKNFEDIQAYIHAKRSATTILRQQKPNNQVLTSEVIYGWMVELRIPFETQHWHLNRLLMLIDVVNEQKKPPKKMGRADAARQQAAVNARRKAALNTKG